MLDLLIANVDSDGNFSQLYGTYISDGASPAAISEAGVSLGIEYTSWEALEGGLLLMSGGYNDGTMTYRTGTTYTVANGVLAEVESYTVTGDRSSENTTYTYLHNGEATTQEEFQAWQDSQVPATLDWQPLSDYSPVEP